MSDDLTTRLRNHTYPHSMALRQEAAAEIERLREALREIAGDAIMSTKEAIVEHARAALSGKGES